jgi:hypothetical protein
MSLNGAHALPSELPLFPSLNSISFPTQEKYLEKEKKKPLACSIEEVIVPKTSHFPHWSLWIK